jgi:hypothetical protein
LLPGDGADLFVLMIVWAQHRCPNDPLANADVSAIGDRKYPDRISSVMTPMRLLNTKKSRIVIARGTDACQIGRLSPVQILIPSFTTKVGLLMTLTRLPRG